MKRKLAEIERYRSRRRAFILFLLFLLITLPIGCTKKGGLIEKRNRLANEVAHLEGLVSQVENLASIDRQIRETQQAIQQEKATIEADANAILR